MRWIVAAALVCVVAPFTTARSHNHFQVQAHDTAASSSSSSDAVPVSANLPYSLGLIRQPFFDSIVVDGIDVLSKLITTIDIPEINQHISDVPVLGAVDLTLNEIQFIRLDADASRSSLIIRDGYVQGTVLGLQIEIRLHWHYRKSHWPNLSGSGHAKVVSKDGRIGLSLAAAFDNKGLVNINLFNTDVDLNKFEITVTDGNASWLYDILFDLFNNALKGAVTDAVKDVLNNQLPPTLNDLFQKQPLDVLLIDDKVHLNTAFYGSGPVVQANPGLVVASNRLEFSNVNLQNCPYEPRLDPSFPPNDFEPYSTFIAFADLTALKCFAWSVRTSNAFTFRVTPDMLPDAVAILNIEAWEDVFPAVNKLYPGDDFVLVLTLASDPELSAHHITGVSGKVTLNADWYVAATAKHPETYVFSTEISLQGSVRFGIWQHWWYGTVHIDAYLDENSVDASGHIVRVDEAIPRSGLNDALFDETMSDLAPLIGYLAAAQLKDGFNVIDIPYARLVNPNIVYDESRGAVGLASQIRLVPF